MPSAKRYLLIALSFVIVTAGFAVFTPRVVHAVTAALVQVVNTSANPVPTTESSVRFQTALCSVTGTVASQVVNSCTGNGGTNFVVPTTTSAGATVKRLVVDNVSGYCSSFDNPGLFIKAIRLRGQLLPDSVSNGVTTFTHYVPLTDPYSYINSPNIGPPYANHQETDTTFDWATHFAFNAGDTVGFELLPFYTGDPSVFDYFCIARVEGALITQ